ncbi:MAG: hypothetical protein H6978_10750 [Gammaproteobacteria bacterium]|nr:hypothetical protein [Gammaproteobacteria bacterium]
MDTGSNTRVRHGLAFGLTVTALLTAPRVLADVADDLRGGWMADAGGERHILMLVVRDGVVSGTYCTACTDPNNLAFVDDGRLTATGARFTLHHENGNGVVTRATVDGSIADGQLLLDYVDGANAEHPAQLVFHQSPAVTIPAAPPGGFVPARPYDPPAPPKVLQPEDVVGLWLFGSGPGKQYFIFRQLNGQLRGMVCGPCDDGANMAPLENIHIDGQYLYFDIVHEDSGPGILEFGPHSNVTKATIAANELHMWVIPSFQPPTFTPIEMTLLGPVRHME